MMITSRRNPYKGVNAHLNSLLQQGDALRWKEFHDYAVTRMATVFNHTLIPEGYEAVVQDSVQIRTPSGDRRPESDVSIHDRRPNPPASGVTIAVPGAQVMATVEAIGYADTSPYGAVVIRQPHQEHPLVWIELLSPTNKQGGRHAEAYLSKRADLLRTLPLIYVELDLLHHSPPTIAGLPSYPAQPESHPYWLILHDVRGDLTTSQTYVLGFDVEQPIPMPTLPLGGDERWQVAFQQAYDETFEQGFFGVRPGSPLDYTHPPVDLDTYSPADRERIQQRMAAIQQAAAGTDLNEGEPPLP